MKYSLASDMMSVDELDAIKTLHNSVSRPAEPLVLS